MTQRVNVLITGAGAPGVAGTIYALLKGSQDKINCIGIDIQEEPLGKYLCKKFYKAPPPEDREYIPFLMKISKREKVRIIIPQTTREVSVLSKHANLFEQEKISLICSSYKSIVVANDKYLLLEEIKKAGLPTPKYYLAQSKHDLILSARKLGYPHNKIVVKPRVSNGMRGLRIISEEKENIEKLLNEKPSGIEMNMNDFLEIIQTGPFPEFLVMEYLSGKEYSVDVFRNNRGIVVIPRERMSVRSGITFDARVNLRKDIIDLSKRISEVLDLTYCFGFQFKLNSQGVPYIIECNPRIQGTMVVSVFAGFNIIHASVLDALEKEVDLKNVRLKDKIRFKRFWGGIAIEKGKYIGRI